MSGGGAQVKQQGNKTIIKISPGHNATPGTALVTSSGSSAPTPGANYNRTGFMEKLSQSNIASQVANWLGFWGGGEDGNGGNFATELPRKMK
ncbi:MAG: hypothetical protein WAM14_21325 [Candidatus Nitrosopolaris sp.]